MLSFFNQLIARIWAIFHSRQLDQELDAEVEDDDEEETDED